MVKQPAQAVIRPRALEIANGAPRLGVRPLHVREQIAELAAVHYVATFAPGADRF